MRECLWAEYWKTTLVGMQRWGLARSRTCAFVDSCLLLGIVDRVYLDDHTAGSGDKSK
jgi:hypothetical protein